MKFKLRHVATGTALLMAAGVAGASTLATVPVSFSRQGATLSGSSAATTLPPITVTLGADYSLNDNIDLVISGATVGGTTDASLVTAANTDCAGAAPEQLIVSFVNRTGNSILLRVTQKNVANTVGVVCTITGIQITDPSIASSPGTISATWGARTAVGNISFDPSNVLTSATVIDQFTSTNPTDFDNTVDVNTGRTAFIASDGAVDTATFTATNTNGTAGPNATVTSVVIVVTGNFANEGGVGCHTVTLPGAPAGATLAVAANCQSATITDVSLGAGVTEAYTLQVAPAGVLVAPQTFSAAVTFNYTGVVGSASETDTYGAGAWDLNGFTVWVPYMPYGSGIGQIIYMSNESSQSGAITLNARNQAGAACAPAAPIATIQGNRVLSLAGVIRSALEACYGVGFSDRVQMRLTANIPANDGDLYSAYNVGGSDRGTVVNDANGRLTDLQPVLDAIGS